MDGNCDPAHRLHGRAAEAPKAGGADLRLLYLENGEQPDDPFTLFNLGSVLREQNKPAEALPFLQRSLERSHPADSIVRKLYSLITQCYQQLGSMSEAAANCSAGRALYPYDPELLFVESLLLRDRGDRRGAEDRLKQLISGREESEYFGSTAVGLRGYKARHSLALLYMEEERFAEAEAQWQMAVLDEPAFFPPYAGIGECLLHLKQWPRLERHASTLSPARSQR